MDKKAADTPTDDQVKKILAGIEDRINKGLGLDAARVSSLDFCALEQRASGKLYEDTENNKLLKAVAEAVAEAGPWNASMGMVARRSGLSKSSLYAHFKSKRDMMTQLFMTEFMQIINFARVQIDTTAVPEEQLYLVIVSVVDYLKSKPEILLILDWIKTGRLELGKKVSGQLERIIKDIKQEVIQNYDHPLLVWIAQWILFMIVNTLAWWPRSVPGQGRNPCHGQNKDWARNITEIPSESFRILFRFIALGLRGFDE